MQKSVYTLFKKYNFDLIYSNLHKKCQKGQKYNISKKELYDLYIIKNKTQTDISKEYGCHRQSIIHYLNKYKIKKRKLKQSKNLTDYY